eukprot:Tbor_TRINITY_DN6147_c3_g1::TRINITY_DN6147_c3_g1_i17::g.22127::m.22127
MSPKKNRHTAAAAIDTEATATGVDIVGQRRPREEPVEEQRAVDPRRREEEPKWTLASPIETILIYQSKVSIVKEMRFKEFVRYHTGMDLPQSDNDPLMSSVVTNPVRYIPNQELREEIESIHEFQKLQQILRDAAKLNSEGIFTLEQWNSFPKKDTFVSGLTKGILNGIRIQNTPILQDGEVLPGFYDSVYQADWHHIVKTPKSS